jgi:hypothetical protein
VQLGGLNGLHPGRGFWFGGFDALKHVGTPALFAFRIVEVDVVQSARLFEPDVVRGELTALGTEFGGGHLLQVGLLGVK